MIKSHWKILSLEDFNIFKNIKGGRVTKNANFVNVFEDFSSKIFLALNRVPKNIIAKNGIVIDKTKNIDKVVYNISNNYS